MSGTSFQADRSATEPRCEPGIMEGFGHWMLHHRGLKACTVEGYRRLLPDLLRALGEDPAQFSARGVREFIIERARKQGRDCAKRSVVAVRMFLRYLVAQGLCAPGLEDAVPAVAAWRLATLPHYLAANEIERIIATCDARRPGGTRDRAILLLLARLGLRGADVISLCFGDIDWSGGALSVCGKGRQHARLPLPQDVGDAIMAYLDRGRPALDDEHVFLRALPPHGPFGTSHAVSDIVWRAMRRAGVTAPSQGAHLLRHSLATEMLRQGHSLQEIATLLRHGSIESTAHYAKVDVEQLKQVAQPWPEVASC